MDVIQASIVWEKKVAPESVVSVTGKGGPRHRLLSSVNYTLVSMSDVDVN